MPPKSSEDSPGDSPAGLAPPPHVGHVPPHVGNVPPRAGHIPTRIPPRAELPDGAGQTILVVDDDPAVRALIVQILRRGGYDVLEASDGERALGLAETHRGPIDLLLTDLVMPGLMGTEVAARLGAVRPDTPTVFVSGQPQGEIVWNGVIEPDVRFVPKPFTADKLLKCVREALAAARV